ncbi:hypothetical protein vBYenM531-1_28 [Yersinia phage vB_YenM_531]|nr:hypothetical protein vBYenM531-1_28 [Yersinia phage vB_YenM_531]QKN87463.1 hypothetical protein vBYenM281_028 [Yersinia phage vB_YenM_281]
MIDINKLDKVFIRRLRVLMKGRNDIHKSKRLAAISLWTKSDIKAFARDYGPALAASLRSDMQAGYYCIDEIDTAFIDSYIEDDMTCWG